MAKMNTLSQDTEDHARTLEELNIAIRRIAQLEADRAELLKALKFINNITTGGIKAIPQTIGGIQLMLEVLQSEASKAIKKAETNK